MRTYYSIILISITSSFFGCSGVHVLNVDKVDNFQISNYKTFNFYEVESSGDAIGPNSKQNLELLKASIAKQLQAKGLTPSSTDPDLLVNIGVVVLEKIQTRETTVRDAPRYMGTRNYSWKSEEVEVGRYREGTVTIHLVEREAKKMVWKGAVAGILPNKESKLPETIAEGMTALFAKLN